MKSQVDQKQRKTYFRRLIFVFIYCFLFALVLRITQLQFPNTTFTYYIFDVVFLAVIGGMVAALAFVAVLILLLRSRSPLLLKAIAVLKVKN
jgi:hypothetical protein